MQGPQMGTGLDGYILLNESVSWTPDLIERLRSNRGLADRVVDGDRSCIGALFRGHDIKLRNYLKFINDFSVEDIRKTVREMSEGGISLLTLYDDDYPARLKGIPDPPLVLYHAGTLFDMSRCVAVSGTREPVRTVSEMTFRLAAVLATEGFTVTSGLALGVDTCAHEGALSIEKGSSVAVVANGLDRVIPRGNLDLARRIAERGAMLSEKVLRPAPLRYDFIRRNRIISGISGLQIIMQSSGSGGTERQFAFAAEQNRPTLVYVGDVLPKASKEAAASMVSRGAIGFKTVDRAVELVKSSLKEVVLPAPGKGVPLEYWA